MATNIRPKIYMGNGGFRGMGEVHRESWLERNAGPKKKSLVYSGGGVSPRVVLSSGGIARGEVVRVGVAEKPSVKRGVFGLKSGPAGVKPDVEPKKPVLSEVKVVGHVARTIGVRQPPMTEREKRAADYFEMMMSCKPMPGTDGAKAVEEAGKSEEAEEKVVIEGPSPGEVEAKETEAIPTSETVSVAEVVEEGVEEQQEEVAAEEAKVVVPKLPLGEEVGECMGGGKRKRRRGKKNRQQVLGSTEISEEQRAELQAAVDAASDAAAAATAE